ncbi:MAG TPA: hypothetical protein PK544_09235 [Spirochaetota bacterium]|nr:hypothetical protein [Spirochaetota bacterium]HPJ37739.1 hypothetical protein [Spirochaetota bacterium]
MADIFEWSNVSEEDRKVILEYASVYPGEVKNDIRSSDPNIYSGGTPQQLAESWVIVCGLAHVKQYLEKGRP